MLGLASTDMLIPEESFPVIYLPPLDWFVMLLARGGAGGVVGIL